MIIMEDAPWFVKYPAAGSGNFSRVKRHFPAGALRYRGEPMKKRATVPGPEWAPMTGPT